MTFYEARTYCQEHNMELASTTNDQTLSRTLKNVKTQVWLDLIQPEPICKNTKCYSWHKSPYIDFNADIEWKKRPSFRYTSCRTKLPFLCVSTEKNKSESVTVSASCDSSAARIDKSNDVNFPSNVKLGCYLWTYFLLYLDLFENFVISVLS